MMKMGFFSAARGYKNYIVEQHSLNELQRASFEDLMTVSDSGTEDSNVVRCDDRIPNWALAAASGVRRPSLLLVEPMSWSYLKKRGNEEFNSGNIMGAKALYLDALAECEEFFELRADVSSLLSNKGSAYLMNKDLDNNESAAAIISMCQAALLNYCGNAKAWVRWARLLERIGEGEMDKIEKRSESNENDSWDDCCD
eukprot:GHVU01040407.1.p1 GENE.GHVU01040407.1~~GHVU01040407.1.p1  ORF type:complete len:198 (+),score=29.95 GHVU01040407.1:212-805(+)